MTDSSTKLNYAICFVFGLILGVLIIPVGYISWEIYLGMPIQTVSSGSHTATLRKMFGIADYNLAVEVDGKQVYRSGDIVGFSARQLRATLVWDKTGRVVAYEQMGKIVFAYDAQEKRKIGNDELKNYCLMPMPENYIQNSCKDK